jgi:Tfp pilus assembly protein PilO
MNTKNLISKLGPIKNFIARYAVIIFILASVLVFGYMSLSISYFSNVEPTDQQIEDKKASLKIVKLNDVAVKKIQELQDQNINIESLFNNGRANPFE